MKNNKATILIVDDEEKTRRILKLNFSDKYHILLAKDGGEALLHLQREKVHLVLTDLKMPGISGLELLQEIREKYKHIPVIIITAYGSIENAVAAMKLGAYDYIVKPIKIEKLNALLEKSLQYSYLLKENLQLKEKLKQYEGYREIITINSGMKALLETVRQVSSTTVTVLIQGESGTGKELFARAVHYLSPRAEKPFVEINCGAIPRELLESELFGHEKGAFTGAIRSKKGKFEIAHEGTLFLDEIGEMPKDLQVKLLHVLENQKFTRVGGTQFLRTDVRIVAATNRNLFQETREGNFRQDLYYRLKVVSLQIPSLRERREDIPFLVQHFLKKHRDLNANPISEISDKAMRTLQAYSWLGNVRELENIIMQAMIFARNGRIEMEQLPDELKQYQPQTATSMPLTKQALQKEKLRQTEEIIENLEYQFLDNILSQTGGNISKAAQISRYDRRQIQNLIRKHRMNTENYK